MTFCAMSALTAFFIIVAIAIIWTAFWKALGLWYAAKKGDKIWFIVFIVVNLAGLLPIIYLYMHTDFFKKKAWKNWDLNLKKKKK